MRWAEYLGEPTYDAYSTPVNHDIVLETTIQAGANYFVYEQFELLGNYNRVYIRIFEATDLSNDNLVLSYWGITSWANVNKKPVTIYYNNFNRVTNENYFGTPYFEVIPEPSTMNLMFFALPALLFRRRGVIL
jgi:hypothetical protein